VGRRRASRGDLGARARARRRRRHHGTRGRGALERALFGRVAERVVRACAAPVLTTAAPLDGASGGELTTLSHVLVPSDFGEAAEGALAVGLGLARAFSAKLTLLHVYDRPLAPYQEGAYWPIEDLEEEAKRALEPVAAAANASYARAGALLLRGDPRFAITEVAAGHAVDLIVMGTHERRGLSRALMGSVAERVVRTSRAPVLTVGAARE
jgi:nucleotide-binding universal stress UspA family protein